MIFCYWSCEELEICAKMKIINLLHTVLAQVRSSICQGADLGGGCRGCAPPPEMTCGFLIQLVFCKKKKKTMWFISVEVEQETSAPLLKKILDPPLLREPWLCQQTHCLFFCHCLLILWLNLIYAKLHCDLEPIQVAVFTTAIIALAGPI